MHTGKSYKLPEFLIWTRRNVYILLIFGCIPVILYQVTGIKWLAIPWTVVGLLGTATAFIVGFKNTQTYNRTMDAQKIWTNILTSSRSWGIMSRDFLKNTATTKTLVNRHIAWLTALRYQMREERIWEVNDKRHNAEYQKYYSIPERETAIETELRKYMTEEELKSILTTKNKATQIMSMQSQTINELYGKQELVLPQFIEMQKAIFNFYTVQGQSESIKDSPYPRQYSTINTFFVNLFCFLLPFGMLHEFDKLNDSVNGIMKGNMVWLVVPFSMIISWMYTSLEQVGESTENPFEGSANDVPISQMCRAIEIELRDMLGEKERPPSLLPQHNIIL
ncbi:putative membrane protein [Chitinophaga sp. YR573]|uniref:bestrophin family protein n=1 Tax=Chitinophaga sp. YR573 TaxID=1881040 RepID=UPI0008CC15E2|nr:bestrophin family ion channel [Chitinophaga sp. YR573]SEW44801.1 putative membrane protein [Chitinophaga sp. YR573]